jgi:hypothetical protein
VQRKNGETLLSGARADGNEHGVIIAACVSEAGPEPSAR